MKIALAFCALVAGLVVGLAAAAPPSLLTVGHTRGHPSATWTLPPGVEAQVLEIATEPTLASDGYFFAESRVVFDLLEPGQTSFLSDTALRAGTYYVHVSGFDRTCFYADQCPVREWSQTAPLAIAVQLTKPTIAVTRYMYIRQLSVRVTWGGNVPSARVQLKIMAGGRLLWKSARTETMYGSTDTTYWSWKVPRRVRRGTVLKVQTTVVSSGRSVTTVRSVRSP
jgi:hypothetical protein